MSITSAEVHLVYKIDSIGIIGQGFVGTAVRTGFAGKVGIETYDKYATE